jgi:excisionase family DNA binding protein
MDKILTVSDVAKQLQMSTSAIYKYTESGKIPSTKIGNRIRVMENDLNEYLLSCKSNVSQKQ